MNQFKTINAASPIQEIYCNDPNPMPNPVTVIKVKYTEPVSDFLLQTDVFQWQTYTAISTKLLVAVLQWSTHTHTYTHTDVHQLSDKGRLYWTHMLKSQFPSGMPMAKYFLLP